MTDEQRFGGNEKLARLRLLADELRARTATLELLDELLATLIDNGDLPDIFDRLSAIARKVLPHDTLLLIVGLPGRRKQRHGRPALSRRVRRSTCHHRGSAMGRRDHR